MALGNDFLPLYYNYKVYLLASISQGNFPWWSPSEAAGFPFYASPFTQAFYPLNVIPLFFYNLLGGYSPLDHQRFTVLGVSIFSLGMYFWLREVRCSPRAALFGALIAASSFKIAEILRFTNAVHTVAWFPWILFITLRLLREPSPGKALLQAGLLCFFTICMLTGGYPYYVYYSVFLFAPYALFLFLPALRRKLWSADFVHVRRTIILILAAGSIAILVCGPYLMSMLQLMSRTTDRGGNSFEYATAHRFTLVDTVGALVFPPAAQTEGWMYFGIIGLVLIGIFLLTRTYKTYFDLKLKLVFLVWIIFVFYVTCGRDSILFRFLWETIPGFSALRTWARLNIVLIPLFGWLLGMSYEHFETLLLVNVLNRRRLLMLICVIGLCVFAIQVTLLITSTYDEYWLTQHLGRVKESIFIILGLLGIVLLLVFVWSRELRRKPFLLLTLLLLFSSLDLKAGAVGDWIWTDGWHYSPQRTHLDIASANARSFSTPRVNLNRTVAFGEEFSVGILENWYFETYVDFLDLTQNDFEARSELLGLTTGEKLFFTPTIEHETIGNFLHARLYPMIDVINYSGNELTLDIETAQSGYLSFIDNNDPDWHATVDDQPIIIQTLFGTFKSVYVPFGRHTVKFIYRPQIFR